MTYIAALPDRAVLEVAGEDRVSFLQGLVSNDVAAAGPGRAVWSALLTPQGKWLADFFVLADGERLLLDCEAAQAGMLAQRLSRYRLRAKVAIQPVPMPVHAAWGRAPACGWGPGARPARRRGGVAHSGRGRRRERDGGGLRRAPPGARVAGRVTRPRGGEEHAGGGRVRRAARHLVGQGLLHGPGADGAHQIPGPGQA